jgi:enoyl-CoA hydratase
MNCVDGETAQGLMDAWLKFRDDDNLFVAIITGAGDKSFCAGADLKNLPSLEFIGNTLGYMGYTRGTDIFKPIIAAINGYCFAGGLEIACLADIRVASKNAEFGCLERRWNVPLADGGTQRLPRIIGFGRAMELIITGRRINAEEAYRIGLVNKIVPREKLISGVMEIARDICEMPQGAIRSDKQAAMRGLGRPLEEGLHIESEMARIVIGSHDFLEGAHAFAQKRKPKFNHKTA